MSVRSLPLLICMLGTSVASTAWCADPSRSGDDPKAVELAPVEVTGTHIRRVDLETSQPLIVLSHAELEATGLNNLGDILQQLPQHVSDLNSDYNNGGNGEVRVDLRNLGSVRTLVLLNGRRYASALDSGVDVGSIPLALVDRVEILTDGTSAVYGSDAIAGTVNIITRQSYEGAQAKAYYASNEQGDGERRSMDITWGRSTERSTLMLGAEVSDQQPIFARDRAVSAVPLYGFPGNDTKAGASSITPTGLYWVPGQGDLTWDDSIQGHRQFDERTDGFNFAQSTYLRTPYRRASLFAQFGYDLSPRTSLRANLLVNRRDSAQQLAPAAIRLYGNDIYVGTDVAADSIYNPFGTPINFLDYRPLNARRRFEQDVQTIYLSLGFEGTVPVHDRTLYWELGAVGADTRQREYISGGLDMSRVALGVGPSYRDSSGVGRCGSVAAPIEGCVPLDLMHGQHGFTDDMWRYVGADASLHERRRLASVTATASMAVADLPAGPLNVAAGLEYRRESGQVTLDALLQDDRFDFGSSPYDPVDGSSRVAEAFTEIEVPLLAGHPFAERLALTAAVRYSHYSSFGSTNNNKFGLNWRPSETLLLRANWSKGFRAPSTSELYSASYDFGAEEYAIYWDPCTYTTDPQVIQRCRNAGVPPGFDPQQPPRVRAGSNPDLQPETSRNRSIGMVWSPRGVPGLDVIVDWWRVELRDVISSMPAEAIPYLCYMDAFDSACAYLQRDPASGELTQIDARLHNHGVYLVEGWDVSLAQQLSTRWGEIKLRLDGVYLSRNLLEIPLGAPLSPLAGNYYFRDPGWRVRWVATLDWAHGNWGATARLRHFSHLDESCEGPRDAGDVSVCAKPDVESPLFWGAPENVIGTRTYLDLQVRWQASEKMRLSLGATNVLDRDPPIAYSAGNSYDTSYDIPGRFIHASWLYAF